MTVSVIIPAFNAEAYIYDAIETAFEQTLPPVEVICVDDGSTDGTYAVLEDARGVFGPALRVIRQTNGGPSAARNRGLAEATGDYVQFLDADDLLDAEKLLHQVSLAEASGGPDLIAASFVRSFQDSERTESVTVENDPWIGLASSRLGITSANLWRRAAVIGVGGWNERLHTSEDPDLAFRILEAGGRFIPDDCALTTLRRRPDSQWNRDLEASFTTWIHLRARIWSHLRARNLITEVRARAFQSNTFSVLRRAYALSPQVGVRLHDDARSKGLPLSPVNQGRRYRWMYRSFGFRTTEAAQLWFRRALSRHL